MRCGKAELLLECHSIVLCEIRQRAAGFPFKRGASVSVSGISRAALWDTHRCSRLSRPEKAFLATDLILLPNRVLRRRSMG